MTVPVSLYESATWTTSERDRDQIRVEEEMKGCSLLDTLKNEDIRHDSLIYSLVVKRNDNKTAWCGHLEGTEDGRRKTFMTPAFRTFFLSSES